MALTATEISQLKSAGYTDTQISVMTEREARKKIEALGGTVEGSTAGGSGLPSGGTGFAAYAGDLFGALGRIGESAFNFGGTVVSSRNGAQTQTGVNNAGTGFMPQILAPENRSNLVWYVVGGLVFVGLGVALYFGLRKK